MWTINMNDKCLVKLTPFGYAALNAFYEDTWINPKERSEAIKSMHHPDKRGNMSFQLWELFQIFGPVLYMGIKDVPFENNAITFTGQEPQPILKEN